jgi:hypothetical protein
MFVNPYRTKQIAMLVKPYRTKQIAMFVSPYNNLLTRLVSQNWTTSIRTVYTSV